MQLLRNVLHNLGSYPLRVKKPDMIEISMFCTIFFSMYSIFMI